MHKVRNFILSRFGKHFFLIFFSFFFILLIVYMLKISILSQQITLTVSEFFIMLGYFLPDILFYTIPLSFIASTVVLLASLSHDNEITALFSLGITPDKLIKIFIPVTLLFVLFMLIVSLYIIPQNTAKFIQFKAYKIATSKLIITPGRLDQKFGDYIIFVDNKEKELYKDIVLFTKSDNKKVLIRSDNAQIIKDGSQLVLSLHNGSGDIFLQDKIESIQFKEFKIYSQIQDDHKNFWYDHRWENIWTNRHDMAQFIYNIFISLSPILMLMIIFAFSITNSSHKQLNIYLIGFSISIVVYSFASVLKSTGTPVDLIVLSMVLLAIGAVLFHKRIRSLF